MGTRDQYETVTKVIRAFADCHTWRQSELARHLGIESRRLRTILLNLDQSGMPLDKDDEHPHVVWSVPKKWFPGGVFFDRDDWDVLVQAVLHVPDDHKRKGMLAKLLRGNIVGSVDEGIQKLERGILGQPVTAKVHAATLLVQQALLESKPLRIHYFSVSSQKLTYRVVSPQRFKTESHPRLVAYCHSNEELRWFRLDNVLEGELVLEGDLVEVSDEEVRRFIDASPDGYHDGTDTEWSFLVEPSAANWVRRNLLPGMVVAHERTDGLLVRVRGGALVVARFIASLGGQATAQEESLRSLVLELTRATLAKHGG